MYVGLDLTNLIMSCNIMTGGNFTVEGADWQAFKRVCVRPLIACGKKMGCYVSYAYHLNLIM